MADIKAKYGTTAQGITISLSGMANNGARASTAVSNVSDLFLDTLVFVRSQAGAATATGYSKIYAYGTVTSGAQYSDGATGTDASITLTSPPNVREIGVINMVTSGSTYNGGPFSVAGAFGGALPEMWGIIYENKTGATLAASHQAWYQGVQGQSV